MSLTGEKMHTKKGFTLIELMIVVAIISVLSSVAIPAYQNYLEETADNACLAESNTYAKRVFADIQLSKPITSIPIPVARACRQINNGNRVTTIATFTALAQNPGSATITCDLAANVICTKNTVTP
jgi:type IV pilus assembly protein PilA